MPAAEPHHIHLSFAIFHDGNPGHLWRGEMASMLGEAVLSAGLVMWLGVFTYSPDVVALALVAMGLPFLLAGPLAATLTRVEEPAGLFRLVGRLRLVFALAVIGMHYLTILPVLYLLLFAVSLCGRLRAALRVAAMCVGLAPGEPERVAASIHFAAVVVSVAGPLLAALLYILAGQRILLIAVIAAALFLLSTGADGRVEPLPRVRRAFLHARPEPDAYGEDPDAELPEDAEYGDHPADQDPQLAAQQREADLPEWEQWGPGTADQAIADIMAGLRLAGSRSLSYSALRSLAALSLIGGGLAVLEVFYVIDHLLQPSFYLGALLGAEGAGLAVGATLWSDLGRRGSGQGAMLLGILGTGVALALLGVVNSVMFAILCAGALGAANALAVEGGREALRAGFDGVQRRALTAAESAVVAFCALAGALLFDLFHRGFAPTGHGTPLLAPLSAAQAIFDAGVGLVLAGIVIGLLGRMGAISEGIRARRAKKRAARARSARGRVPARLPDLDDAGLADSRSFAAAGHWDDEEEGGDYGESGTWERGPDDFADSRYDRSYGADSRAGWDDEEPEDGDWGESASDYGDYGAPPGRGGWSGPPAPRAPRGRGGRR